MSCKENTCRRCNTTKDSKYFYNSRRNISGLENICIDCKRIEGAARRFRVPEQLIEHLYKYDHCMCCKSKFSTNRKLIHIHHTQVGIRGIVCFSCNYILGAETDRDKHRIQKCIDFMTRDNPWNTVNQQERPFNNNGNFIESESSETTRCETLFCIQCNKSDLTQNDFQKEKSRGFRQICRKCANKNRKFTGKYKSLKDTTKDCNCCNGVFSKTNKSRVHHINETFRGIVCNRCNQILGDESEQRKDQLLICLRFMI